MSAPNRTPGPWRIKLSGGDMIHRDGPWNRGHGQTVQLHSREQCVEFCSALNSHDRLTAQVEALRGALQRCDRLFREALPKFNWGASALDANAIQLLNEVPNEARAALAASKE